MLNYVDDCDCNGLTGFLRHQQCLSANPYLIKNPEYYSQNITECTGIPITDDPPTAQDSCKWEYFIFEWIISFIYYHAPTRPDVIPQIANISKFPW